MRERVSPLSVSGTADSVHAYDHHPRAAAVAPRGIAEHSAEFSDCCACGRKRRRRFEWQWNRPHGPQHLRLHPGCVGMWDMGGDVRARWRTIAFVRHVSRLSKRCNATETVRDAFLRYGVYSRSMGVRRMGCVHQSCTAARVHEIIGVSIYRDLISGDECKMQR